MGAAQWFLDHAGLENTIGLSVAKILIIGAGQLGLPLARQLSDSGHQITAIRRSHPPADAGNHITWLRMDLRQRIETEALDRDFDLIIVILTPAARSPDGYRQIYQTAMMNLFDHLAHRARRPSCLFVSSTSVYAQHQGEWVDEESPTEPDTYRGKSLLSAEEFILSWSPQPLIIRFAGIYGPGRTRLLDQLKEPMTVQRTPPTFTNRVHQDDCIGILQFLAERQLRGQNRHHIYLGADHDPAPKFEVMGWLARAAGLIEPRPFDTSDHAPQNKRCHNHRLRDAGYRFRHPDYQSGYGALLETFRVSPANPPA